MFDVAKLANEKQMKTVFSLFFVGKCLFKIPKRPLRPLLFHFQFVEPAFVERDADAQTEIVLIEFCLSHVGSVEIWNVRVCPLHSQIDSGCNVVPCRVLVGDGDGETCRNTELIGLVSDGACGVSLGIGLCIITTDLVSASFEEFGTIRVRCPVKTCRNLGAVVELSFCRGVNI